MSQNARAEQCATYLPNVLYVLAVVMTCAWVLSLPVFPSRDGPLHLYYINAFRQVLAHKPGVYWDTYSIRTYLPPYATYYYGLIGLGSFVSLELADKMFVCFYVVLFAISTKTLIHSVGSRSRWIPFLFLPVLLNWPLMMGFVNYAFATCLACFALAAWCVGVRRSRLRYRIIFLALSGAMVVTHPLPWMFAVAFVSFDLIHRWARSWETMGRLGIFRGVAFKADLVTAMLAISLYGYLARFKSVTQNLGPYTLDPITGAKRFIPPPGLSLRVREQALSLVRTHGLDVFSGHGLQNFYRIGIDFVFVGALAVAVLRVWKLRSSREWQMADTWLWFSLLLIPCLIIFPDEFGGGYFFVTRLQVMLYVSCIVAAS